MQRLDLQELHDGAESIEDRLTYDPTVFCSLKRGPPLALRDTLECSLVLLDTGIDTTTFQILGAPWESAAHSFGHVSVAESSSEGLGTSSVSGKACMQQFCN